MSAALEHEILAIAAAAEPRGASMGEIVDRLAVAGHGDELVEAVVWQLLESRYLTLSGYVQRRLRQRDRRGVARERRSYEFTLVPWSPERDGRTEST
ncbi:MAG: hypothetical protein B7733_04635 [Myxococcales bacterium FL481]|nr:MAG: hypothetical protein B7733_04635 [Myxococcales bacterium FL481]